MRHIRYEKTSAALATVMLLMASAARAEDWSEQQIARLPATEKAVHLFNGKDLTGWTGQIDPYWSVVDGLIVGKNDKQNAPQVSTYLLTEKKYRNFRLLLEAKLVTSEMHTGVALWGKQFAKGGQQFSYQGHLVMFPGDFGIYDLFRRNVIYKDKDHAAKPAGHQHEWNQLELLAIGSRIRLAINGHDVADWTDSKPELCQAGPLGLQLHANNRPQEVNFRGLILSENPEDKLITAAPVAATKERSP
ncbi:MAG: DUF1080 domain-containing protein [Planctomycetia bacterium]|nr:DUF1080 domain-containing protein [Planctomycetia bacterium]